MTELLHYPRRITFDFLLYGQICVQVPVAILEEWWMAMCKYAIVVLLDERIVAHGPLVS